jgi:hypothetical protein
MSVSPHRVIETGFSVAKTMGLRVAVVVVSFTEGRVAGVVVVSFVDREDGLVTFSDADEIEEIGALSGEELLRFSCDSYRDDAEDVG